MNVENRIADSEYISLADGHSASWKGESVSTDRIFDDSGDDEGGFSLFREYGLVRLPA